MLGRTDRVSAEELRRLHAEVVSTPGAVRGLLERAREAGVWLDFGLDRHTQPMTAEIVRVEARDLLLRTRNLTLDGRERVGVSFRLDGRAFFWESAPGEGEGEDLLRLRLPRTLYVVDRRERVRRPPAGSSGGPARVALQNGGVAWLEGRVADLSARGIGVELAAGDLPETEVFVRVRFMDGPLAGREHEAEVRHRLPHRERAGWVRLGLELKPERPVAPLQVQRRASVLEGEPEPAVGLAVAPVPREPRLVEYTNDRGESLRALVDVTGDPRGAPVVLIPPAWGRTKETLLPLAATLLEMFARAGQPLVVIRFDGIRKRGESYNDPPCRAPGRENLRFTISQGVRDIHATLDFLERSPEFASSRAVLVSFSASAVEARRAVLEDAGRRLCGWIAVVGAPDLHASLRRVSGGLDFVGGGERGVRFGLQEIQGIVFDADHLNRDLLAERLPFLEDARRDMAGIRVPVTWIHGRHDAWMEFDRVRAVMESGDPTPRQLLEVPTGHQLRASHEALEVFQLIGVEVGRMALGRPAAPAMPDLAALEARRRAERDRLAQQAQDFRRFWRSYLLGREGDAGIELMTAASAYRDLMATQLEGLALQPGDRVADLGAGTGSFALALARAERRPSGLRVEALDYVPEALTRARARLAAQGDDLDLRVHPVVADLQPVATGIGIPLASGAYDAVLASLLLSYVADPARLLREILRLLRPGGRAVLSTLRCDADTSKLYMSMLEELAAGGARELLGDSAAESLPDVARRFLNEAARVLDFEEQGRFHFWDPPELERLVGEAGFVDVASRWSFGDPPQAVVLAARKPSAPGR